MTAVLKISDVQGFVIDPSGVVVGIIGPNGKRSDLVTVTYDPVSFAATGIGGGSNGSSVKSPTYVLDANGVVLGLTSPGYVFATTVLKSGVYTVATLPAGSAGARAIVTDATTPTFLGALTGGGAVVTPVVHNGTAWIVG